MKSLDIEFFDGFVSNVCKYNFSFQVVKNKTLESIEKLLGAINERFRLKDPTVTNCYERLDGIPESDLKGKCIYHSECYKELTNVTKLRRLSDKLNPVLRIKPSLK